MVAVREVLASGAFLDRERVRGWLVIAASATFAMVMFGLVTSHGLADLTGRPLGTDFISFWTAARVAIAGPVAEVWTVARHRAEQVAVFGPGDSYAAFFYPPVFLFVCWPFGHLPYLTALVLWLGTTGLACFRALVAWAGPWSRGGVGLLAFVGFPAFFSTLGHGQNAFLTTAIFATGGVLLRRRPVLAGIVLGCLVYKPHMALALPIVLAASGRWRAFAAMGASAATLIATSVAVFGVEAWRAFFDLSAMVGATLENGLVDPAKMVSVHGGLHLLGVPGGPARVIQGGVVIVTLAVLAMLCRRHRAAEGVIAAAAAATLLINPFMLDYDTMLLAVPMAWLVRRGLEDGCSSWERVGVLAAFVVPGIARPIAMAIGIPVAPVVTALLLVLVMRRMAADGEAASEPTADPA